MHRTAPPSGAHRRRFVSNMTWYHDCYQRTGWVPMAPLTRPLKVGDVAHIRHGRFQTLLNLADVHLQEAPASREIGLDSAEWRFGRDVQQTLCETWRGVGDDGEAVASTRQVLEFAQPGAFLFHAGAVSARLMVNWARIRDDVTLKLTQLHYGLRDAYVVTGVARASDWALAVAGRAEAHVDMSAATVSADRYFLLGDASASAAKCHGIAAYERADGQDACFFRAKKLVLSDATVDRYLGQLLEGSANVQPHAVAAWLDGELLGLAKNNDLTLNTSIGFFSWADLTLDDVERLAA